MFKERITVCLQRASDSVCIPRRLNLKTLFTYGNDIHPRCSQVIFINICPHWNAKIFQFAQFCSFLLCIQISCLKYAFWRFCWLSVGNVGKYESKNEEETLMPTSIASDKVWVMFPRFLLLQLCFHPRVGGLLSHFTCSESPAWGQHQPQRLINPISSLLPQVHPHPCVC